MAKDPGERYPVGRRAGAGGARRRRGLRRAGPRPLLATGAAGRTDDEHAAQALDRAPRTGATGARVHRHESLSWAIAIAGLLIVALGMVAALRGISTL